jgi:hypothetical protein
MDRDAEARRSHGYLAMLAHAQLDPAARGRIDLEGVVQQTVLPGVTRTPPPARPPVVNSPLVRMSRHHRSRIPLHGKVGSKKNRKKDIARWRRRLSRIMGVAPGT